MKRRLARILAGARRLPNVGPSWLWPGAVTGLVLSGTAGFSYLAMAASGPLGLLWVTAAFASAVGGVEAMSRALEHGRRRRRTGGTFAAEVMGYHDWDAELVDLLRKEHS